MQGTIFKMDVGDARSLQVLTDVHFGDYVGMGVLAASANVCVVSTCRGPCELLNYNGGYI